MPPINLTYRGVVVELALDADIPAAYRPIGHRGEYVQQVLDQTEPWKGNQGIVQTITDLKKPMPAIVIPISEGPVIWGKHIRHQSASAGLSPFVCAPPEDTKSFTIVLSGPPEQPVLERAFPGEYIPPLPWQIKGGPDDEYQESLDFWRMNGFVYFYNMIQRGTATNKAPGWFFVT